MQLHQTEFYTFTYDEKSKILKFLWTEKTADMKGEDFKEALTLYAGYAEEYEAPRLMIDVRAFKFNMTSELGTWRDEVISPRYNMAGVKKFAYVVPEGSPMASSGEQSPKHETFITQYFDSEEKAQEWLLDS